MYKVLVIEDDPIMGKVMRRIFASDHCKVSLATTAQSGMETCLKELPDLVLLDIVLPDGNGLELCRRMKVDPKIKHIPIIIVSGAATSVDDRIAGIEAGAEDYILKPFITEELMERAAGILKRGLKLP